ncbi:MAP7 domain-containing protein 3 isoform X6 [Rhinolophus ferrumequinum]|uniref:MAP7 domain-containing protein 3 isoform X6 n=1 Tax=Rhinolophus ferrumequinum TaxID=59479 RepID=UPI00140F7B5E|nr:MAP7 domain-containing protein 3 isoform X6 [Rhinolophus ferrumequinum]
MAERAGAGGSTSLRGLRERMVAAAQAIAKERRNQSASSSLPSQSSSTRSAFKPVIDGSVLKNDIKQKLAKERREEMRRQQDANKEIQLLEKERKAKIQYEKQMEEKQRKLREQKEKDEQRRISAEEKRKQKLREEKERFKAVLCRTLERSNTVDQRQKRWSWEGSMTVNSESKTVKKRSVSTEKLEQETSGLHKQTTMSSAGLQNSVAKKKTEKRINSPLNRRNSKQHSPTETEPVGRESVQHLCTDLWENDLIMRLIAPTKASIARSKSAASLSVPGKVSPAGIHNPIIRYINMPLLSRNGDELKNTPVPRKSTVAMPPQEKVETPLKVSLEASPGPSVEGPPRPSVEGLPGPSVEGPPGPSVEGPPRLSVEGLPGPSVEGPPGPSVEGLPGPSMEAAPEVSVEAPPKVNVEAASGLSEETLPESVEASPEGSDDVSLVSVDPSPEVSTDSSLDSSVDPTPEVSTDSSAEVGMEVSSSEANVDAFHEPSMEAFYEASMETIPEESTEVSPKESVEASPESSPKSSPDVSVETSSEVKVRNIPQRSQIDIQASNRVTEKQPSSHLLCYKWASSASGWHPPSPVSANRQIQKNRSPSLSPVMSKQSTQCSLSSKIIPDHGTEFTQSALGIIGKKKEAVSKPTKSSEAVTRKHMTYDESGNKSTQGTMNAKEATKILAEKRRLAREQREKEERLQKEMEQRKEKDMAKKAADDQEEEFSKFNDRQQLKEMEKETECQDQEDQKMLQQKGDAKIKAQEEAEKRKKERERIMLQNLQERLERKKRIEEIMKRTRKTDSNASKAVETSTKDIYEEDEADDEDESESDDEDSFDGLHPSAFVNGMDSFTDFKTNFRNVKNTPNLVFLDPSSGQVHKEPKASFKKSDMKNFRQNVKDPLAKAKGTRLSTKRMTNQAAKTRKTIETSNTMGPSKSVCSGAQGWTYDKILDIESESEPLMSSVLPDSQNHHLKGSTTFHQSPQTTLDSQKRNKSDSAQSDM